MPSKEKFLDYEPLTAGRKRPVVDPYAVKSDGLFADPFQERTNRAEDDSQQAEPPVESFFPEKSANWLLRRGHAISFIGLFLFTIAVYLRPYELIPALMPLRTMAFWLALATFLVFVPTQLGLEGNLTARPREINLLFLFTLAILLSVPLADDPSNSFGSFVDFTKVLFIFIVMVNVIRTDKRLKWLLLLLLATSCFLGASAVKNYAAGVEMVEGFRVRGSIGNMFDNPNDMALHLVTMVPISIGLFLGTRNRIMKLFYVGCALLMMVGIVLTFSRGGLLGLMFAMGALLWKLRRGHGFLAFATAIVLGGAFIVFAPGGVASRFGSVFDQDQQSSVSARKDDLKRSLLVTLRHPLFGIGIGNYMLRSNRGLATHNSYTQVSSEVGIAAFVLYVMFIVTPLKRLRTLENRLYSNNTKSYFYYMAVGMQVSLIGYMVCSFFASVAFLWYIYYLVAMSVCLTRIYEIEHGIGVSSQLKPGAQSIGPASEPRMSTV